MEDALRMASEFSVKTKLPDLQAACQSLGLSTIGAKKVLSQRLNEYRTARPKSFTGFVQARKAGIDNVVDKENPPVKQQHFDAQRLHTDFHDLQSPADCVSFLSLVKEYTDHVREVDPIEDDQLATFVALIDNEVGWSLASQVVKEFRQPLLKSETPLGSINKLLQRVVHRLPSALDTDPRQSVVREYEREAGWRRLQSLVACLAPNQDGDVSEEVDRLTTQLSMALDGESGE